MAISRPRPGRYDVSGADNTLNLRWSSIYGRATDDGLTLNRKNIGGWGFIDMGSGNDTVTLAASGDYTLQLRGVETIKTTSDAATLSFRSDVTTATDGSFTAITAGYGVQDITYTGAVRDSTLSLGELTDYVTFSSTASVKWQGIKEDGVINVYNLDTGYKITLDSSVEYARVIDTVDSNYDTTNQAQDDNPSSTWTNGWVDLSTLEDGDTFGANLADALTNQVVFLSDRIEITASFGGFAAAYGTTSTNQGNGYWGYWYYAAYDQANPSNGWVQLGGGATSTLMLQASTEVDHTSTVKPLDGFTWAYFFGDEGDWSGLTVGGTRLIVGTANADTGGAMDQSTDTLDSLYGQWWDTSNYAMYGFGGADSIIAGSSADTVWGGDGNDTILGGAGNDYLNGEGGTNY